MQDHSILFTASVGIVSHSWLNKCFSKFLHHSNTFSGFPLYLGALSIIHSILSSSLPSMSHISSYLLSVALPVFSTPCRYSMHCTLCFIHLSTLLQHCFQSVNFFQCSSYFLCINLAFSNLCIRFYINSASSNLCFRASNFLS